MDGPLRVVGQDRNVQVDLDVARVFDAHVHVDHLTAVNRHIGREVVRTHFSVVVLKMNVKGFLREHRDDHALREVHARIGERSHVARDGIGIPCGRYTVGHQGDKHPNGHGKVFENVQRLKINL